MFTGIIESTGRVLSLQGKRLELEVAPPIRGLKKGESLAVDGCCLTVVSGRGKRYFFDLSEETLQKTKLGGYRKGTLVNLERSLKNASRFGGHFVLGHVDAVGKVKSLRRLSGSLLLEVSFPKGLRRYMVEKGSVTVDGISLTLFGLKANVFKTAVIPHTEKVTNIQVKKAGDPVNLEADVLAKYAEGLILKGKK